MEKTNKRKHEIYLGRPARYWDDGLPIGNGRLGAMVMGKPNEETIFINEETLWYGADRNRKNPDTLKHLETIRSLLFEGKVEKAQFLAKMAITSTPKYMNPYQPAGDMRICLAHHNGKTEDYERRLDIDRAEAVVSYRKSGHTYRRTHFVSHKYQVLAVQLETDAPEGMTLSVNMSRKPFEEYTEKINENTVSNYGECGPGGIHYFTGIRLAADGAEVHTMGDFAYVNNAKKVWIYLDCRTDYPDRLAQKAQGETAEGTDFETLKKRCLANLDRAEKAGYEVLYQEHEKEYAALYGRMDFSLRGWEQPKEPTDVLLGQIKEGDKTNLLYLTETLFHFARYLMISSTYDCLMPSNLQGIWNGEYAPPWQCEFTININTEMNYWMAEKCSLPECHLPLFDQVERMMPNGEKTAKELYGCRGFCAHHNTNIWANTDPEGIFDASPVWSTGAAWLSLHFYEHYRYTKDREFLKTRAIPVMREAIRFYEDYLTENPEGYLVTGPSLSPENTYRSRAGEVGALCMGPAMDMEIIRQLFTEYLEGCRILGLSKEVTDEDTIREILAKLPPLRIGSDGRLMEWQEEAEEMEPGHRHISHLYALHPGREITEEKPELFEAAKKTLNTRLANGGGHTGWSRAWVTCFFARLKEGDKVGESIEKMFATCIKDNLLDTHPPFQIDGNFGIAEAMLEGMVQSHAGYVEFLPALPPAWTEGSLKGVILEQGIAAEFSWKDGKLTRLSLTAKEEESVTIRINGKDQTIWLPKNKTEWII